MDFSQGSGRELPAGDHVTLGDVGDLIAVQDHVHLAQGPSGVVVLLAVGRHAARRLGSGLEQQ